MNLHTLVCSVQILVIGQLQDLPHCLHAVNQSLRCTLQHQVFAASDTREPHFADSSSSSSAAHSSAAHSELQPAVHNKACKVVGCWC